MTLSKKQIITVTYINVIKLFIIISVLSIGFLLGVRGQLIFAASNIALGKTTNASGNYSPSGNAVNGNLGDMWNSGSYPPQWVEIDLGSEQTVGEIKLYVAQLPAGQTSHEIWIADSSHNYNTKIDTINGRTADGQVLDRQYNPAITNVRYVKALTTQSPSWAAWKEIEVYGAVQITPTPTFTPTPTSISQPTATPTSIPPSTTITQAVPTPTSVPTVTVTPTVTASPSPTITSGGPTLTPAPTSIPGSCPAKSRGDANCDGKIDYADFQIWFQEFDTMVSASPASQNANYACVEGNSQTYFVDLVDFEIWRRNTTSGLVAGGVGTPTPTITPGGPTQTPGGSGTACVTTSNCAVGYCCVSGTNKCQLANTTGITCLSGTAGTNVTPTVVSNQNSNTSNTDNSDKDKGLSLAEQRDNAKNQRDADRALFNEAVRTGNTSEEDRLREVLKKDNEVCAAVGCSK